MCIIANDCQARPIKVQSIQKDMSLRYYPVEKEKWEISYRGVRSLEQREAEKYKQ